MNKLFDRNLPYCAEFEGQRIPHLVKSCEYKSQAANEQGQEDALSKHQDDYVLRRLFKKTGTHAHAELVSLLIKTSC